MTRDKQHADQSHAGRTGKHPLGDAGQILFACLFFITWLTDSFLFEYTTNLNTRIPLSIRFPLGILFTTSSIYMALSGLNLVFRPNKATTGVVDEGAFRFVRHPIYMSEILLYLSCLLFSISLISTFVLLLIIIFLHSIARYEEKLLLARYGDQYENYRQRVPMWIPRFWKHLL